MADGEPVPKGVDSTPHPETRTPRWVRSLIQRGGALLRRNNQQPEPRETPSDRQPESYYDRRDRIRYAPSTVDEAQEATQVSYAKGLVSRWTENELAGHPELPGAYARLLLSEGILPAPDRASGFVLYSPSAHQGLYEETFARYLDAEIDKSPGKPDTPPQIIAADMFGIRHEEKREFRPGFDPEQFSGDGLHHVKFEKRSAEAKDINFPDGSIDVIWDRLGALWHAQQIRTRNIDKEEIVRLLNVYEKVLKPDGCVVVDAAEGRTRGVPVSTFDFLEGRAPEGEDEIDEYRVNLQNLGWNVHLIGAGEARLAILQPLPKA